MIPAILTCNGSYFYFSEPEDSAIDIKTIAHALANICRFTGHTQFFYSVAQHSVMVSRLVPPQHALAGLLHDATEAYLGDVAAPLKALLPDYRAIEARVQAAVMRTFGLPEHLPPEVKDADTLALAIEQDALMPAHADVWPCEYHPGYARGVMVHHVLPQQPILARKLFLMRYMELTGGMSAVPCKDLVTDWAAA